ncbi:MAG: alpha/beta fold hydrolase [Calditrichaeota bacterium]|nr:alpha/beta fold hydrolase [Calditrichota bacterium]
MKNIFLLIIATISLTFNCQKDQTMQKYEKPVVFERDGNQLVGIMHFPRKTSPKYPTVILLHGFTGNKAESHFMFTEMARELAKAGFVCLRFDFFGSGDSEGTFEEMTYLTELADANAALAFLRQQPEVDVNKIGVLGLSMGGGVAALLAGSEPDVKSLVLLSAVSRPEENFKKLLENIPRIHKPDGTWYLDTGGNPVGQKFFEVLPQVKPLETIKNYAGHALIIHGNNDVVVPESAAYDYFDLLKDRQNVSTELKLVEGADHVFSSVALTDSLNKTVVDWFERTLK